MTKLGITTDNSQPSVLLVADFAFQPAVSGNTKRVASLVAAIRSWGFTVHFLGLGSGWPAAGLAETEAAVDSFEIFEWKADLDPYGLPSPQNLVQRAQRWGQRQIGEFLRRWPPALDPDLPQRCPEAFCSVVKARATERRPVAVIVEYLWLSRCLVDLPIGIHRVIDAHDLMHQRLLQFQGSGMHSFFQCSLEDELKCLRRADSVLVIQEEEKRVLARHLDRDRLVLASHGHPISIPPARKRGRQLLFAGSAHAANVEGIQWFLRAVWPLLAEQDSIVTLVIVGRCCEPIQDSLEQLPGRSRVELRGVVDDLVAECHQADLMVNPILRGSGLKIKVVEALCCGMGLVSTTKGIEGIDEIGRCPSVRVEDQPQRFASAVLDLLNSDLNVSETSIAFATERFSIPVAYAGLRDVLRKNCHRSSPESPSLSDSQLDRSHHVTT